MKEIWKDVVGYEGKYQASNKGRIRSVTRMIKRKGLVLSKGRVLKPIIGPKGYAYVSLGQKSHCTVHRLIAKAFLIADSKRPCVNHKNGIKHDNKVDNLEWVSPKENAQHAKYVLHCLYSPHKGKLGKECSWSKPVKQISIKSNKTIKIWECAKQVERALGYSSGCISMACNGLLKQSHGYRWSFANDSR